MVDRPIVQVGELPCVEDVLGGWKSMMFGLGYLAQATIGNNTGINGFNIAPTIPASLSFTISAGSIYAVETADATAYGVLGTDSTSIFKQGLLTAPVTLTVTPPSTSGFSQVYIVQVAYADVDTGSVLVPFFNSADPSSPSSSTENTIRQGQAVIELKAGTAAPTGSQTTPSPDAGFVGIYAITVANGVTSVTSSNWITLPSAPFFPNLESLRTSFIPSNYLEFTSSGSFTVPVNIGRVFVRVWGGGGGGGGVLSTGAYSASGGAAGGGYSEGYVSVTAGQVIAITVGAGGTGGAGTPSNGSVGGTSSFGSFISATGGAGGLLAGNGGVASSQGAGGTGTGGGLSVTGFAGNGGLAATNGGGGSGGGAFSTGTTPGNALNGTGASGNFPGGGGGGTGATSSGGFAGGVGAAGLVVVQF